MANSQYKVSSSNPGESTLAKYARMRIFSHGSSSDSPVVVSNHKRFRQRTVPMELGGGRYGSVIPNTAPAVVGVRFQVSVNIAALSAIVMGMPMMRLYLYNREWTVRNGEN